VRQLQAARTWSISEAEVALTARIEAMHRITQPRTQWRFRPLTAHDRVVIVGAAHELAEQAQTVLSDCTGVTLARIDSLLHLLAREVGNPSHGGGACHRAVRRHRSVPHHSLMECELRVRSANEIWRMRYPPVLRVWGIRKGTAGGAGAPVVIDRMEVSERSIM
jgi:hypothetical protein